MHIRGDRREKNTSNLGAAYLSSVGEPLNIERGGSSAAAKSASHAAPQAALGSIKRASLDVKRQFTICRGGGHSADVLLWRKKNLSLRFLSAAWLYGCSLNEISLLFRSLRGLMRWC
ncbi:hypothetical protein KP509_21G036700 [Ceratopteris richardii]|uniref:Uncharacterized protein n=1 Tax=Ceratopteris richardii TaxID=49495 RepID=A0A8T2SCC2_CERRI|nr:hypothetical protein KP509_21G036700 [Ceratopteris richardii]